MFVEITKTIVVHIEHVSNIFRKVPLDKALLLHCSVLVSDFDHHFMQAMYLIQKLYEWLEQENLIKF